MDPGFLNDSTIYYNLPPTSEVDGTPRRSTLPRPHSTCFFDRTYSCPASPKSSIFNSVKVVQNDGGVSSNERESGVELGAVRIAKPLPPSTLVPSTNGNDAGAKVSHSSALKEEEIAYPEVVYENVNAKSTKFRKKYLFPWWKKKKKSVAEEAENVSCSTEPKRKLFEKVSHSKQPQGENQVVGSTELESSEIKRSESVSVNPNKESSHSLSEDTYPCSSRQYSSSCSSSTTSLNDFENEANPSGESVVGGVTYVRPSKTPNQEEGHCTFDSPRSSNPEFSARIAHKVREWRRKSRWLNRRRKEKNPRHNGEGDLDIAIIHCENDTVIWADYLCSNFTNLFQDKRGRSEIRIEKIRIEAFTGYQDIPEVQASRIKNAKLQMLILSPGFLSFINCETELLLGKFLRPNRVLALLLGVTRETIKADNLTLSSLYSFEEWPCLDVRDRDEKFVTQVQEESLKLLNRCDLFDDFKTSSAFNICPRKITQVYCKVYIHLRSPLLESQKNDLQVSVDKKPSTSCSITSIHHHNPYTISFDMPEKLLGVSSFLKVNLFIGNKLIGSREVKCEGPMEVLRDLLKTAVDPVLLMCQALDISPASDDLDEHLAQKLRGKLPTLKWIHDQFPNDLVRDKDFPTWLHFSAFYGLQNFTWALLELQNYERALVIKNSKGRSPAKLALQAGYTKLAQDLENLAIVMSLAQTYCDGDQELDGSPRDSTTINCSTPLQTSRPYLLQKSQKEISPYYDIPQFPRPLSKISFTNSQPHENNASLCSESTVYANLINSPAPCSPPALEEYLDMSGSFALLENYKNDICTLVTAWDTKNDVQSFLNEYEPAISKLKENLHLSSAKQTASVPNSVKEENEELPIGIPTY